MKPSATFKQISQLLMDSWISGADGGHPEEVYGPVDDLLRPHMALLVVDTSSVASDSFRMDFIKRYELPTGFESMKRLQQPFSFADFPDRRFLCEVVAPANVAAAERQHPVIDYVAATVLDVWMAYDRLVLPQKNSVARSNWCISLIGIHILLPAKARVQGLDDSDLAILQLLAEGMLVKEIGNAMNLSPRTIEHRVERLKSAFGARNIPHLVSLSIASGISKAEAWPTRG
ncbi:LuxR family transcriptional regulator [Neorhizobium sp. P12A]|uniref:helix-turn-helix domain-containing protein n=1 Tax=Neorhizobium sp. P12A TaxID=2268027 RepID=UPI0011ECAD81|nr:helix-turn-helix transcriptional regulator [Neorhizobium sp. P12A]KAA0695419.1 LuxR family transcriptional regulator [Neorhizobium sp. P12A]